MSFQIQSELLNLLHVTQATVSPGETRVCLTGTSKQHLRAFFRGDVRGVPRASQFGPYRGTGRAATAPWE